MDSQLGIIYNKKQFEVFYEVEQMQMSHRILLKNGYKYNNILLNKAKDDFVKFSTFKSPNINIYSNITKVFVYDSIVDSTYKKDFSIVYTLSEGNIFIDIQIGRFVGNGMNIIDDLQLYIDTINLYESEFPNNVEYDGVIVKADNIYVEAKNKTYKMLEKIKI